MDQLEYIKILEEIMLCQRGNAPEMGVSTRQLPQTDEYVSNILVSDKNSGQLNPLTSTPLKICGVALKMQFLKPKFTGTVFNYLLHGRCVWTEGKWGSCLTAFQLH